jgi:NAD(P)-dependent dehydrogenase (short-subunit alcohol dehydrogenase family)
MTPPTDRPRLALITGASRGLGAALAEALAARGWHVVAVARTLGALEELDDRIRAAGGRATLAPLDLTQDDAIRHLCRGIHDRWGGLDLWAHTAMAAPPLSPAGHIPPKDWDRLLAVAVRATGVLIPMVEPLLRARLPGAAAVAFDDPAARDAAGGARAHFGAYAAAKAAQAALFGAWAAEAAALGPQRAPRVLIHAPAPMPTATRARFFPGEARARLSPCAVEAGRALDALGL